jgi:integrase
MTYIRIPYIKADVDRHGNSRYYFRRRGAPKKIRLPGKPFDEDFMNAYHACLSGKPLPAANKATLIRPSIDPKSMNWLCQQYLASHQFKALDIKTRMPRRSILEQFCELSISDEDSTKLGTLPFEDFHSRAIRRVRDRKTDTPEAANNWLKSIRALFRWGCEEEQCSHNPAKDVPKIRVKTEGHHTWTMEEVAQWESFYAIGTKPRLAFALLLYTGGRRADVVAYGPQHIRDGSLTYTQNKNRNSNPITLTLPVLPDLAAIIAATKIEHMNFVVSDYGKPYTIEGFGKRFRKWAKAAGLPHCTPHGLRKAGAVRCAESGATASEMMAIFGWRDIKQAELYTRRASQKDLAATGLRKLTAPNKAKTNVAHFSSWPPESGPLSQKKP